MPFPPTPSRTPTNTPTPSITASRTPTLTPSSTPCPFVCCFPTYDAFTNPGTFWVSSMSENNDGSFFILGRILLEYNYQPVGNLIRIDRCGALLNSYDLPFIAGSGGVVQQSDGKWIIGAGRALYRLNADYSVDNTFCSGYTDVNLELNGIQVNSNDEILIVGGFGTNWNYSGGVISYNTNIYKFDKDGNPDLSWSGKTIGWMNPGVETFDNNLVKDYNGKIMAVGFDSIYGNSSYFGCFRLNDDFSLDTTFNASGFGLGRFVYTCKPLANGDYMIGGNFTDYSGYTNQDMMIQVDSGGTIDLGFTIDPIFSNKAVYNIGVQSTGKYVVSNLNTEVIRLNTNGSLDNTFLSGTTTSPAVYNETSILVFNNDMIFVGGAFVTYNGQALRKLVKLLPNGALDVCAGPTPTPTVTKTPTRTPQYTLPPTGSPTRTPTRTPDTTSPSATPTNTPTITPSTPLCDCYRLDNTDEFDISISFFDCGGSTINPECNVCPAASSIYLCIQAGQGTNYTVSYGTNCAGGPTPSFVLTYLGTNCINAGDCI